MSKNKIRSFPETATEIFKDTEEHYYFNTDHGLDNIESLKFFIRSISLGHWSVELDEGTRMILVDPDNFNVMILDSFGNGDEFSHVISVNRQDCESESEYKKVLNGKF